MPKNAQTTSQLHSSHTSKVMLKIIQARLQQYVNLQMFKLDLGKAEEPEIKFLCWIIEKAREFQKNIDSCFIDYANSFDCVHHNKLWKILQEMTISYLLTCFLRNLYAGQKATVRTRHGTTAGSKLGKEFVKAVYCHPAYLTYAEYIMRSAGLEETEDGIKLLGEISITSDMQMTPSLWQKVKRS